MCGQRRIQLIFDRQDGVAERGQLIAAGLSERVIDYRLKIERYRRVHRRVYALGPLSMRARLIAALLAGGEDADLCHASALVPFRLLSSVVTVDVALPRDRRDEDQIRFHRLTLRPDETTRRDGLRVTTIERTLFDIAATGADIRRLAHEAIAKKLTTQAKLSAFAARHRGERGAPAMRRIAGEPHTRSSLERRFLRFLDANDLPRPIANHPIGPYHADCYWPQFGLIAELDEDGHKTELAFEEDRARDRFYAGLGLRAMRVTDDSLRDEATLRQEVRRAARIVR
jgi:very-short-patch-repair endonuclease